MYGGQLRSSMPWTSQAPRKRTASKSTRMTSFRSSATFSVTSSSCLFNSRTPSGSIRPLTLRIVFFSSELRSILRVTFGFHGGSECRTESTRRKLNIEQLQAGWSGGYRHMVKFVICLRTPDEDGGSACRRPGPEITFLQNLDTAAQNRVAPVPIARSPISGSQAKAEQYSVPRVPRESGSEQDRNVGE